MCVGGGGGGGHKLSSLSRKIFFFTSQVISRKYAITSQTSAPPRSFISVHIEIKKKSIVVFCSFPCIFFIVFITPSLDLESRS